MLKQKKSYFHKIIRNFIMILCVPMSAILLIYAHADNVVKDQVLDAASQKFDLYCEQIEGIMKDMKETCLSVYSNADCKMYSLNTVVGLGEGKVREEVRNFLQNLTDVRYHDIFIYYSRDDKCISGNHVSMAAERYYDTYYGELGKDQYKAEFLEILKTEVRRPKCHVIYDYTGRPYLCMTMGARNPRDTSANYTVCVVLSPEYLNTMMKSVNEGNALLVYNEDRRKVLSKSFDENMWEEELILTEIEYDTWTNQKDYMIQVKKSQQVANEYVYMVSSDSFWDELWQLRVFCFVGIFACVLVSSYAAVKTAKRIYVPIGNIVNYIQKQEQVKWKGREDKEFSDIMSYIHDKESRMREYNRMSREWFLFDWLEGKIDDVSLELLAKNDISLPHGRFLVCIFQIEMEIKKIDELHRFIIQNVIEELWETKGKTYFTAISKNKCVMLVDTEEDYSTVEGIMQEGQQFLEKHFPFAVTIGFSNFHEELGEVTECYKEAQEAMRYRFIAGRGKQIYYKDICGRSHIALNKDGDHLYMMLMDYIEKEDENCEVDSFVESLMSIYAVNEAVSIDVAMMFRSAIVHALSRIMKIKEHDIERREQIVMQLKQADTMGDFQRQLCEYLVELKNRKEGKVPGENICAKAKSYIDENYHNNQLSVAMVGKALEIQSGYLSRLFKEAYSISMLEYIASLRIGRAKQLLQEGELSIAEIAEQVGFVNSHTFIRGFKKSENITPGKYRELHKI